MEPETKKKVVVGSTLASLAAVAVAWQQIGNVFVLQEQYRADYVLTQMQFVDVQLIQANAELNAILQREAIGKATPQDLAQKQILIQRIADLQKARREMAIKK